MMHVWLKYLSLTCALAFAAYAQGHSQGHSVEPELPGPVPAARPARYDSVLMHENLLRVKNIAGYLLPYHDSTATQVLARHNWNNAGLVADWTASMLKHNAMMIRWYFREAQSGGIQHFSFFNDGDGKYDDEKEIGLTGGIYHCESGDSLALWQSIEACVLGGNGGDHRENVLEALLEAFYECPDCEEFVLVADNCAPIRDISLLKEIDRPVRVVLVGVYKDGINPDYLNLAYRSGGTLHTRDLDLLDFSNLSPGGVLMLSGHTYQLHAGIFRKIER